MQMCKDYMQRELVLGESPTHQATLIFIVGVSLMQLLLPVTVVIVVAGVKRLLRLVDETAAAADSAQSQLGHW